MNPQEFQKIRASFKTLTGAARTAAVNAMTPEQRQQILTDMGAPVTAKQSPAQQQASLAQLAATVYEKRRAAAGAQQ